MAPDAGRAAPLGRTATLRRTATLGRSATIALVALAVLRSTLSIVPQVRFDTDPAINPDPFVGIGPAGSLFLDVLLLAASALAFTAELRAGRRIVGWLVACALVPAVPIILHGQGNALDLFRGATWLAAAVAAVAAAHLARDPVHRRWLQGGLLAMLALLVMRGAEQVLVEHEQTVRAFEATKAQFFAERGWDPAGAAARSYERRLRQPEATGWFTLSNLFSAAMAFGTVAMVGITLERWRAARAERGESGSIALMPVLLGLGCVALLVVNGSKGAIAATAVGIALVGAGLTKASRLLPPIAVALVLLAALAPTLRGALGEDALGERSLLFRSQYLDGAVRAFVETLPWGVGPDGFQDAYVRLKPERSPEDVQSVHAMAADWLVTLGPWGITWIALALVAVWNACRIGRGADADQAVEPSHEASAHPVLGAAVAVAIVTMLVGALAELPIVTPWWLIVRTIGSGFFVLVWISVDGALAERSATGPIGRLACGAAFVAVAVQSQIEMVYFMPGLVLWAWLWLGVWLVGDCEAQQGAVTLPRRRLSLAACASAALASWLVAFGLVPQVEQDRMVDEAAGLLHPVADLRAAWPTAQAELKRSAAPAAWFDLVREVGGEAAEAAMRTAVGAATTPEARVAAASAVLLDLERSRRIGAAERLLAAREAFPSNWQPERAAIDQLVSASRRGATLDVEAPSFLQAIALATDATAHWRSPRFASLLAELLRERAAAQPGPAALAMALEASTTALTFEPLSVRRWIAEGDVRAANGEPEKARAAWQRALELDAARELDPVVQLAARERRAIEQKIAALGAPPR